MSNLLNKKRFDALQHPLVALLTGGSRYDIYAIDVESGLTHILVSGLLQRVRFSELLAIEDAGGAIHNSDDFYLEDEKGILAAHRALVEVAEAYESWEASLLSDDAAWKNELPTIPQALWDRFLEIQTMRNAALAASKKALKDE